MKRSAEVKELESILITMNAEVNQLEVSLSFSEKVRLEAEHKIYVLLNLRQVGFVQSTV